MSPTHRQQVLELIAGRLPRDEFLRRFGGSMDGQALTLQLLEDSLTTLDPDDVEYSMMVGFTFGFSKAHLDVLCRLADADWHFKHEDIVTVLGEIGDSRVIPVLYQWTQRIPDYLSFDENRALAVKAIWAIARIDGPDGTEALRRLSRSDDQILKEESLNQLNRALGRTNEDRNGAGPN